MSQRPATGFLPTRALILFALSLVLASCQFRQQHTGPQVAANTVGAGQLTTRGSQKVLWIMPSRLTFTGTARYQWPNGQVYNGDWVLGKRHGQGQLVKPNGWRYAGRWQDDAPHGQGELLEVNGDRYQGEFEQGRRQGIGLSTQTNGTYQGQWHNDMPQGQGSFTGNDGDQYQGSYKAGQRDGIGTSVALDGSRYRGDWVNNKPHGQGELREASGATYQGGWVDGLRSGYGEYQDSLGRQYQGTWSLGKYHGFGKLTRADNSRYEGEWQQGLRHGTGTEHFAQGGQHIGEWSNNRALGTGSRTTRNGIVVNGLFNGDRVSHGLLQLPSDLDYAGPLFRKQMTQVAPRLLEWTTTQAQQGSAAAQLLLASFYQDFEQPLPNVEEAVRWYRAAARSLPDAQFRLGLLLLKDEPQRALPWLNQAAQAEHRDAQFTLAEMYRTGDAVSPNAATAAAWYQAATAQGHQQARINWAWLLATSQEAHARDPKQALGLIKPVVAHAASWQALDTLAATFAALARYPEAVTAQQQALALLETQGQPQVSELNPNKNRASDKTSLHQQLTDRLQLYVSGQAYVEVLATAE